MNEKTKPFEPPPDDALVEALRDAYQPAPLEPLRRARIRASVRARVALDDGKPAPRSGWGLVPAAAALAGVLLAIGIMLNAGRGPTVDAHGPADDDLAAVALLLGDSLVDDSLANIDPSEPLLPEDYEAISQLLGGSA